MSQAQNSSASGTSWIIGAVISILVLIAILAGTRFFSTDSGSPEAEVLMTPRAGGRSVPTATPAPEATPAAHDTEADNDVAVDALQPGTEVLAATDAGAGVRLSTDPGGASVMDVFDDGTLFVIVEPSDDYEQYPVEVDGEEWYRVRAPDGLVGWIEADILLASE